MLFCYKNVKIRPQSEIFLVPAGTINCVPPTLGCVSRPFLHEWLLCKIRAVVSFNIYVFII